MTEPSLHDSYDAFPRIEAAFASALDESLQPRSPRLLFDLVDQLVLPPRACILDLGCGDGRHTIALAEHADVTALGIDPVRHNIEAAAVALREAVTRTPAVEGRVRCVHGAAEALPVRDGSIDLVWCREVLYVLADLDAVFSECRRVLRPGGRMLIYCNFVAERGELPGWWYTNLGIVPASADPRTVEATCVRHGFRIEQSLHLGSEFGEHAQETTGEPGRRLLHAARLLREPQRYIERFGQTNYDIMLSDCLWHVYRMIGMLSPRVYVLTRP